MIAEIEHRTAAPPLKLLKLSDRTLQRTIQLDHMLANFIKENPHLIVDFSLLQFKDSIPQMRLRSLIKQPYRARLICEELGFASLHNDHVEKVTPVGAHQPGHAAVPKNADITS